MKEYILNKRSLMSGGKNSFFIIVSLTMLMSCSDTEIKPKSPVVGKWDWFKSIGGFTGNWVFTPENTGHSVTYVFNNDLTYLQIDNGDTLQNYIYEIKKDTLRLTQEPADIITLYEQWWTIGSAGQDSMVIIESRNAFTLKQDTLRFIADNVDSYRHFYKKE